MLLKRSKKQSLGRVLMLLENPYPQDTRVRNEATLLQSAGYDVTVFTLKIAHQATHEVIAGVRVYRLPRFQLFRKTIVNQPGLSGRALLKLKALTGYAFEHLYFTTACFVMASYILVRHGFDVIHAHNPPD